jgi:YjbR protein
MATAADFRRIAMSLEGTAEYPHFDRAAFKVARTYATLAADGKSANFKFTPEEQVLKVALYRDAFTALNNAWGKQGWTEGKLSRLDAARLRSALETAWQNAQPKPKKPRKRSR